MRAVPEVSGRECGRGGGGGEGCELQGEVGWGVDDIVNGVWFGWLMLG